MFETEEDEQIVVEKPKEQAPDPTKELREEVAALRGRVSETEKNAQYWYEQARASGKTETPAEDEDEAPALDEDLVDVISSGDNKKVVQALKKLGFVSEKEVSTRIAQTRQQIAQEAELFGDYPDLKNKESELFVETAKEYAQLAKEYGDTPKTLKLAAKLAAAAIGYEAPTAKRRQPEPDDDEVEEQDRIRRVATQNGGRGRNNQRRESDGPDEFSDTQNSIIARFQAAGSTLTADSYRERATKGVRMGARNAGHRGKR